MVIVVWSKERQKLEPIPRDCGNTVLDELYLQDQRDSLVEVVLVTEVAERFVVLTLVPGHFFVGGLVDGSGVAVVIVVVVVVVVVEGFSLVLAEFGIDTFP
ncbi:hypothetical protein EDD21DRAFT_354498 [Dissophora ornata]|nr:hypothetical protein EDD21DRAFT_354498 [Dissophora ornata]